MNGCLLTVYSSRSDSNTIMQNVSRWKFYKCGCICVHCVVLCCVCCVVCVVLCVLCVGEKRKLVRGKKEFSGMVWFQCRNLCTKGNLNYASGT